MSQPLVTVYFLTYNRPHLFPIGLRSIQNQTFRNFKVLVIDNGSTPPITLPEDIACDPRFEVVRIDNNAQGRAISLNILKNVDTPYTAYLFDDDRWTPSKLEKQVALLERKPDVVACFTHAQLINTHEEPIPESRGYNPFNVANRSRGAWAQQFFFKGNCLCQPSLVARAKVLAEAFPPMPYVQLPDLAQWVNVLAFGEIEIIEEPLTLFSWASDGSNESAINDHASANRLIYEYSRIYHQFRHLPDSVLCEAFDLPLDASREAIETALFNGAVSCNDEAHYRFAAELSEELFKTSYLKGEISTAASWGKNFKVSASQTLNPDKQMPGQHLPKISRDLAYEQWLKQREFLPEDSKVIDASLEKYLASPIHFHLVLRLQAGDEALLADTLDTLDRQCYPAWHLDIVSTLPAPDGMNDLLCLGWHTIESLDDSAQTINTLASSRLSGWVIELPPGARLDQLYLWRIAEQSVASPDARAFFVDDDCCDDTGQRHSPRFKPGSNQSALLAADLAGPLAIRQDAWQTTGGASQVVGSPWYAHMLRIAEIAGWPGIQHIPDVLITYLDFFPSDPQSCMQALQKKFEREKVNINTIPLTKTSWRIRFPLDITPAITIAIVSRGQLELLSRCIESLLNTTRYPDFEVIVAVTDGTTDPDLIPWIENFRTNQSIAIRVILLSGLVSNFATLGNAAAKDTTNEFFVLLDENSFIVQESWLEELVRTGLQPDVAAVSPLLAKQGTAIVHNAGGVIGLAGLIGSPHCSNSKITDPGYLDCIQVARDVTVLPASCLLLRTKDFLSQGGMDESVFGNHLADADLCQRLAKAGRRLIFEPQAIVVHGEVGLIEDEADDERKARKQIAEARAESEFSVLWLNYQSADRFWNPNLSLQEPNPTPEISFRPQWQYLPSSRPRFLARPVDNGQGFFRISSPLRSLRKAGLATECLWYQAKGRDLTPQEMLRLAPDTLIVQNYISQNRLAALKACHSLPNRPFIVYALDDLITNLSKTNPFSSNIPPNSRGLLKFALAHSDRLVVSTDFLADTYRHLIPDIRVVANRLEQETWLPLHTKKRTSKKPRIGWAGGTTHQGDLILLKEIIEKTRNEADWIFFGMCPDEIRPLLAEYHPLVDFHQYPAKLASLNLDIAVAPLAQIPFNRGKSNLRLLEYGILGIPVVCTDIDPYRGSPACCVANGPETWIEALRERMFDADAREEEGMAIRRWVQKNYLLENHLEEWLNAHLPN